MAKKDNQQQILFSENFMQQHVGRLLDDPLSALVELVANAWDAGSTDVLLLIPRGPGRLEIKDNGVGMNESDFLHRWATLSYDRREEQGPKVAFPADVPHSFRVPFGRNGIGRHAMFCFNDSYEIVTAAGKEEITYEVQKSNGAVPFILKPHARSRASYHGTKLSTEVKRNFFEPSTIGAAIGERFVSDPNFAVTVNGERVEFAQLQDPSTGTAVGLNGEYVVHRIGGERSSNTKYRGIAWWVNGRLVGAPSWDGVDGRLLDGRGNLAHRYTYIVIADPLSEQVKKDWSGFHTNEKVNEARRAVTEHVGEDLLLLSADTRAERKRSILQANAEVIRSLPRIGRGQVEKFVDEVQANCPTMGERELENAARIFANMEKTRGGYALLEQLSKLPPDDLDGLTLILSEWSVNDAKKVLDELSFRLQLIKRLESLVEKATTDELHDLQPLFEIGLWIFGPEFESLSFISNRALATVVKAFFGEAALTTPTRRADFVVLPNASIGIYACDKFDAEHEISGFEKIVIVELKRGGFMVGSAEKYQANDYSLQLRKSGRVGPNTPITCYVLGTTVDPDAQPEMIEGKTTIFPFTYERILKRAHSRTFNLLKKLESIKEPELKELNDGLFSNASLAAGFTAEAETQISELV